MSLPSTPPINNPLAIQASSQPANTSGSKLSTKKKIESYQLILSLFLETEGKKNFSKNALSLMNKLPDQGKLHLCPDLSKTMPEQVAKNISKALANGHLLNIVGENVEAIKKISNERSPATDTLGRIIHYLNSEEMCEQWSRSERNPNTRLAVKRILEFVSDETQKDLDLSGLGLRSLPTVFSSPYFSKRLGREKVNQINEIVQEGVAKRAHLNKIHDGLRAWVEEETAGWTNPRKDARLAARAILDFVQNNDQSSIDLSNFTLKKLPPVFSLLEKRLTSLTLLNCGLEDVAEICDAPSLRELCLAGNKLKTLPNELATSLPRLEELNLRENSFEKVPPCIYKMDCLRKLDLSQNGIYDEFTAAENQSKLESLSLEGNPRLGLQGGEHLTSLQSLGIKMFDAEELAKLPKNCKLEGFFQE